MNYVFLIMTCFKFRNVVSGSVKVQNGCQRCVTLPQGPINTHFLFSRLFAVCMFICLLSCKHSPCSPGDASSSEQLASYPPQEISLLQGDSRHQPRQPPLTPRLQTSPPPPPFLSCPCQSLQGSPPRASNPCHLCS